MSWQKTKHIFLTIILVLTTAVFVFGGNIKPAQAILGVGDLSVTVGDVPRQITDLIGRIRTRFGSLAFQRAIRSVSYKLAQDAAVFIGNGGKGKQPLIFEDFGSWAKGAADEVAGKYIVNLTAGFPVDFCSPSSIKSQLAITLGISKSLSQIKIGEALLGYCPPGSAQSTQAKVAALAKGAIIVISGVPGDVLTSIGAFNRSNNKVEFLSQPVPWQENTEKTADAIIAEINRTSPDFVASGGGLEGGARGGFRVIITAKEPGSAFNYTGLLPQGTGANDSPSWGVIDALYGLATEDFSGGTDAVAASTGLSNCTPNVNRDIGAQGCSFSKIRENFNEAVKAKNFLVDAQTGFEPGKNDLLIASTLAADAKKKLEDEKQAQTIERLKTGDLTAKKDLVTGQIRTPNEQTRQAQADAQVKATKEPPQTQDIFVDTLAVFANTLAQTYLKRLQSGYYPFRSTKRSTGPDSELAGAAGSTEALISSFAIFSPNRALDLGTAGEVDLFSEMTICPPAALQTPYNCLLGSGLQQAIQQGLSVAQAVSAKYIDPNLLFPENPDPNQPKLSADNLAKLRFLRVLPVGWELAADILDKNGKKITMSALLDCFANEDAGGVCDEAGSGNNDLYHLVDPDWILALPKQFCRAQGYTSIPENEKSPNRQQICVDLQSCLKQDNNGNCQAYGYCTRERAVWQLPGQSCDAQYATCRSLRRPDGSLLSILGSDVNAAGCTQGNAGCSWYSRPADGSTNWTDANRIYLTSQAPVCSIADAGSREIIPLEPGVNLFYNDSQGPIKIKPYAYYTVSFAPDSAAESGVSVAASGASNVSFPADDLILNIPAAAGPMSRYAATFFSGPARTATITPAGAVTDLQLEEVGLAAGKRALDVIQSVKAANPAAGIETFNVFSGGTFNQASPATAYHSYATNRRLVFAAADTCQPEEASARVYTPLSGSGAAKVARLTAGGLCPAECAGLDTFLAMPTPLEELATASVLSPRPVSFIPAYGRACNAAEVGCEEFTNLSSAAPEQKEYYSRIEACVLDSNPNAATFYTWQGTDTAGFQLKAWQLLQDDTGGPCGNFTPGSTTDPAAAGCPAADPPLPPRACEPRAADPNCRVFMDTAGVEYTRDIRQLVTAAGECRGFRRTNDNQTWFFIPSEANRCSPPAALCRQYKGRQANVTTRILFDDFAADADGWDVSNGAGQFYLDAVVKNGHSYLIPAAGTALKTNDKLIADQGNVAADYSFTGKTFIVKFLSRSLNAAAASPGRITRVFLGSGATEHDFPAGANEGDSPSRVTNLTNDWREYIVGPVVYNAADLPNLSIEAAGSDILIDNIELTQVQDNLYLITDSWQDKQPAVCTAGAGDERFGRCRPYRDTANNTYYVSRFAALFDAEAQFCRAVIDTQNSDAPGEEIFNQKNDAGQDPDRIKDNVIVPADDLGYFILKPENLRFPAAAGCTAVGKPNNAAAPTAWETNYRRIDPDAFAGGALCRVEGLGCQSFQSADGVSGFTFRDPGTHLCAYNSATKTFTQLDAAGNLTSTDCPVNPDSPTGWVRQCPAAQSSCTAYAPSDPQQGEGGGAAIFALASTVETGNCTGSSLKDGCLAFTQAYSDGIEIAADNLAASTTRALIVKSTRQCAEWLSPVTTSLGTDPKGNASRTVVYDLGRCQELGPDGRCLSWADSADLTDSLRPYPGAYIAPDNSIGKFSVSRYQARRPAGQTLFSGAWDYSGYSLPNQYPLELLREDATGDYANQRLVLGAGGSETAAALACRSYPEEDAPFASARIDFRQDEKGNLKPNYGPGTRQLESLNKCAPGEDGLGVDNCECSYKKVTSTDGEAAYFSQRATQAMPAETESVTTQDGWYGYCVAYDYSTLDPNGNPICLTWWPVDAISAKPNVFDNHPEAGFTAAAPQYYCLAAKGNKLNNDEFGITPVKAASGADLVKDNNYFIEVPYIWNQNEDTDFRVNIAPFAINVGGNKNDGDWLIWGNVWEAIKTDLSFLVPGYGWFRLLTKINDAVQTEISADAILVFPFNFIGFQNKNTNRIVLHTHGCAIHPSTGGCISEDPDSSNYLEGGKSEYRAGEYELNQKGWSLESGLLTFPVNNAPADPAHRSPLADLHEYDIEKIIIKPLDHQYSDWPKSNTEIILQRDGWAQQAAAGSAIAAETDDRWTAYWCTGESCDFGDKFRWDTIVEYLKNTKVNGTGANEDREGLCATLNDGTNLLAVRAVFTDAEGKIPEGYEDFKQGIAGMNTGLHKHNYVKNFGFSGSHREPYSFLGLQGGICDKSSSHGWVPTRMIIQLREWCTTVAAVTDTATGENRAWTGRVNNQSTVSYPADTRGQYNAAVAPEKLVGLYTQDFTFNQDSKPFGAIVPPTSTIYTPEKWDSRLDFTEEEAIVNGRLATIQKPLEPGKQPLYVEAPQKQARAGSPFACIEAGNRCVIPPVPGAPQTNLFINPVAPNSECDSTLSCLTRWPFEYLKQIFVKVYNIWQWEGDGYKMQDGVTLEDPALSGECPIMQAVEIAGNEYRGTEEKNTTADCGHGKYSINGKPGSTLQANPIQVDAGVEVFLDFYAYNDNGEQLPLREIRIDWDEGKPETVITGNFKNHHPNCDNNNFGRSGQACDPNIFQFKHIYQLPGFKTPILTVIDNWGKATRSSYTGNLINVNEPRLNLPPVSLQHAPSGNPESGTGITFNWIWTPPEGVSILNYRLVLTKNFADVGSIPITPPRQGDSFFSVPFEPLLQSVSLSVRPCLEQGCGIDARETVYYRPSAAGAISVDPNPPIFDQSLAISWPASPLADSYEVEFDQKGPGVAPTSAEVTGTGRTYQYEPGATHVRVRVRPKNGPAFGDYSFTAPERLEYQDVVLIDAASVSPFSVSWRTPLWHAVATNKPVSEVDFYLDHPPVWLRIDQSGVLSANRALTAGDARLYTFNVEANHGPTVTVDTKEVRLTVIETCGNGSIDGGEQCEPSLIANNSAVQRCTSQCAWELDLDGDSSDGSIDCNNSGTDLEAPYVYPNSPHRRTEQRDYNCNGLVDSATQCTQTEEAFGFAPSVCPVPGSPQPPNDASDTWCRDTYGSAWYSLWRCNIPREVGCEGCTQSQTVYY